MKNIIEVNNVSFEYITDESTLKAIDNLDLKVKEGEFVAIIGHNGSGKSTLSKNLNAILFPTKGNILINKMDTREEEKLWDIRQTAGMYELKDRQPHLLSGGQKQRVAIAGIIAMKPKCIIFDEATAMLDPLGRKEVMKTIKRLNKEENITTLHITHFMEEAVDADRVIVMEKGKKLLEGIPKEVFSKIDTLKHIGLDVPCMTELSNLLKLEGLDIRDDILTVDEMVMELCQL